MKKYYGKENDLNLLFWAKWNFANKKVFLKLNKIFNAYELSSSQFAVLESLYHSGPQSIAEIKERILISGGNITVVIINLEKKGLVKSQKDEGDRRRKIISLTCTGERLIEPVFMEHLDMLNATFTVFNHDEKKFLIKMFNKILKE